MLYQQAQALIFTSPMLRASFVILGIGLLGLTGCDCLHSTQFHICPNTSLRIEDPSAQQREVMPVLRQTATQLGLEERDWPLRVNGAFCLFSEPTNGLSS